MSKLAFIVAIAASSIFATQASACIPNISFPNLSFPSDTADGADALKPIATK